MPTFNLYSKRQKALRGEVSDVYSYDAIPQNLRVQIVLIIQDMIGVATNRSYGSVNYPEKIYNGIYQILCREYGKFYLTNRNQQEKYQISNFILQTTDIEQVIDTIELTFSYANYSINNSHGYYEYANCKIKTKDAIEDLNTRFKENSVGYSFEGEEIIRVDSTYIHSEITKPVISLLWNPKFKGASEEYMKAHEHYRHGRNKECLTECLKAFESTMKIICTEKGWAFDKGDAAKKLIQICLQNGLVPEYMQTQISSLKGLFESGIPTIRNKLGGHGQGAIPQTVDNGVTRYGLNLTGANIIFMIEQSGI